MRYDFLLEKISGVAQNKPEQQREKAEEKRQNDRDLPLTLISIDPPILIKTNPSNIINTTCSDILTQHQC